MSGGNGGHVKIKTKQIALTVPLNVNGRLSLNILKQYFPGACGLTFNNEAGQLYAVDIVDDELIIPTMDKSYNIHPMDESYHPVNQSETKERRIREIITSIRDNSNVTKKEKKASVKNVVLQKPTKTKTIHVGWMHRSEYSTKFTQTKKPFGGVKKFQLNTFRQYSVEDIKSMAVEKFIEDGNKTMFEDLVIDLGFYDGRIVKEFRNSNGCHCDFWEYCQEQNMTAYKAHMYLFTHLEKKSTEETKSDMLKEQTDAEFNDDNSETKSEENAMNIPNTPVVTDSDKTLKRHLDPGDSIVMRSVKRKNMTLSDLSIPNSLGKRHDKTLDNTLSAHIRRHGSVTESLQGNNTNLTDTAIPKTVCGTSIPKALKKPDGILSEAAVTKTVEAQELKDRQKNKARKPSEIQNDEIIDEEHVANNTEDIVSKAAHEKPLADFNPSDVNTFMFGEVVVRYHHIVASKYSLELSTSELEANQLFSHLSSDLCITREDFEPLDFGYMISEIYVNGDPLLMIDWSKDPKTFSFPSLESRNAQPHTIIYDSTTINGKCGDRFGIGIIPSCTDVCHPKFTWYRDGQLFKSGEFFYWIHIPNDETSLFSQWTCEIECKHTCKKVAIQNDSKTSDTAVEQLEREDVESAVTIQSVSMPLVERSELGITKILLGQGSQGKVRKATWLGTTVAVKTIKIAASKMKLMTREINLLCYIRHPNIVQTMALCMEPKQLHIVMEFVDGDTLSDIIFEEETSVQYNLNVDKKNCIAIQVCQAINYLHLQDNSIIHRDIKPDNILVDRQLVVKLCDMGLGKFKHMATAIRSTVGIKRLKGTLIYMAPEVLLHQAEHTVYSDVWSTACTIVELCNGECVWTLDTDGEDEELLREILARKQVPNITNVPDGLKNVLERCFSYVPDERPTIADILACFTS